MKAESNGVTTTIQPHGWSWVDQPLVGATMNGLNVYAVTIPQSITNCYRKGFKLLFVLGNIDAGDDLC